MRDDHGLIDNVQLHQGTIINPTGITLGSGMVVSVDGYNAGSYFVANEIDTPYTFYSGVPFFMGHPWNYYGPSSSLSLFFGQPAWWHGAYGAAPRINNNGAYVYNRPVPYRGGVWHGHNYVAPPERGGYVPHAVANAGFPRGGVAHAGTPHGHGGGPPHH